MEVSREEDFGLPKKSGVMESIPAEAFGKILDFIEVWNLRFSDFSIFSDFLFF